MLETYFRFRDEDSSETRRALERFILSFLIFIKPTDRTTGGRILYLTLFFSLLQPFISLCLMLQYSIQPLAETERAK